MSLVGIEQGVNLWPIRIDRNSATDVPAETIGHIQSNYHTFLAERGASTVAESAKELLAAGEWAVLGNAIINHLAEALHLSVTRPTHAGTNLQIDTWMRGLFERSVQIVTWLCECVETESLFPINRAEIRKLCLEVFCEPTDRERQQALQRAAEAVQLWFSNFSPESSALVLAISEESADEKASTLKAMPSTSGGNAALHWSGKGQPPYPTVVGHDTHDKLYKAVEDLQKSLPGEKWFSSGALKVFDASVRHDWFLAMTRLVPPYLVSNNGKGKGRQYKKAGR